MIACVFEGFTVYELCKKNTATDAFLAGVSLGFMVAAAFPLAYVGLLLSSVESNNASLPVALRQSIHMCLENRETHHFLFLTTGRPKL